MCKPGTAQDTTRDTKARKETNELEGFMAGDVFLTWLVWVCVFIQKSSMEPNVHLRFHPDKVCDTRSDMESTWMCEEPSGLSNSPTSSFINGLFRKLVVLKPTPRSNFARTKSSVLEL